MSESRFAGKDKGMQQDRIAINRSSKDYRSLLRYTRVIEERSSNSTVCRNES